MGRNTKEIELFGSKLILSERTAGDVLSFSEFVKNNSDEKTIGIALYQSSIIVETGLKSNKKEMPKALNFNIWYKILRFFGLDKAYKAFLIEVEKVLEYNSKITAQYLLDKLSQKEIFDLVKQVYELEGAKFDTTENTTEKKN